MTPKERAVMQQALEALEGIQHGTDWNNGTHAKIYRPKFPAAITALREALAEQAEQEPVGVVEGSGEWGIAGVLVAGVSIGTKLYAAPVHTKDLTDDEIEQVRKSFGDEVISAVAFARAVIAADREKNK